PRAGSSICTSGGSPCVASTPEDAARRHRVDEGAAALAWGSHPKRFVRERCGRSPVYRMQLTRSMTYAFRRCDMRFKTWPVAALGLLSLVILIAVSMMASASKAQEIYSQLDQLNDHHRVVEVNLRRLRSDVNLSGIFVRDYLLDVARERATGYRE